MKAPRHGNHHLLGLRTKPTWAEVWHLWRVIIPRRSISGKLVSGKVWRRWDGGRWIYKNFVSVPHLDMNKDDRVGLQ
jgi:hypothetical protein